MNLLYAFLIAIIIYVAMGTLFFALVEKLRISVKLKVLIMTLGHPLASATLLWFGCSIFNQTIAEYSVLFVCGSLLRTPFSSVKYFSNYVEDLGTVSIEYFSELMQKKTIQLRAAEIETISQDDAKRLIDKPSYLIVSLPNQTLKFKILDRIQIDLSKK